MTHHGDKAGSGRKWYSAGCNLPAEKEKYPKLGQPYQILLTVFFNWTTVNLQTNWILKQPENIKVMRDQKKTKDFSARNWHTGIVDSTGRNSVIDMLWCATMGKDWRRKNGKEVYVLMARLQRKRKPQAIILFHIHSKGKAHEHFFVFFFRSKRHSNQNWT